MTRKQRYFGAVLILGVLSLVSGLLLTASPALREAKTILERPARIHPDYSDVIIPPNIAPLNFVVDEPGGYYHVSIHAARGDAIEVFSKSPEIRIPIDAWRSLLKSNQGEALLFDVHVQNEAGDWTGFQSISNIISSDPIDSHLVYRRIGITNLFHTMDIVQRDITSFDRTSVIGTETMGGGCVNCHTFLNNRPDNMVVHVRGTTGPKPVGMLLVRDGQVVNVDTRTKPGASPAGYISWHPSGKVAAFSTNRFRMYTHSAGFLREVFDFGSDLSVYHMDTDSVSTSYKISDPVRFETFPAWSPDGQYLYFCSTLKLPPDRYKEMLYDLKRIRYHIETDTWGELETVLSSRKTGLSITQPRISPDGRFLLFCMSEFGNFVIYQPSSDLYLMDLETRDYRRLDASSEHCDSWHSWSSNSRWFVFSSKRLNGLFSHPCFCHVDEAGNVSKPLLLPQENPAFYDSYLKTFNVPELVTGPIPVSRDALVDAVISPDKTLVATVAEDRPNGVAPARSVEGDSQEIESERRY